MSVACMILGSVLFAIIVILAMDGTHHHQRCRGESDSWHPDHTFYLGMTVMALYLIGYITK